MTNIRAEREPIDVWGAMGTDGAAVQAYGRREELEALKRDFPGVQGIDRIATDGAEVPEEMVDKFRARLVKIGFTEILS